MNLRCWLWAQKSPPKIRTEKKFELKTSLNAETKKIRKTNWSLRRCYAFTHINLYPHTHKFPFERKTFPPPHPLPRNTLLPGVRTNPSTILKVNFVFRWHACCVWVLCALFGGGGSPFCPIWLPAFCPRPCSLYTMLLLLLLKEYGIYGCGPTHVALLQFSRTVRKTSSSPLSYIYDTTLPIQNYGLLSPLPSSFVPKWMNILWEVYTQRTSATHTTHVLAYNIMFVNNIHAEKCSSVFYIYDDENDDGRVRNVRTIYAPGVT